MIDRSTRFEIIVKLFRIAGSIQAKIIFGAVTLFDLYLAKAYYPIDSSMKEAHLTAAMCLIIALESSNLESPQVIMGLIHELSLEYKMPEI